MYSFATRGMWGVGGGSITTLPTMLGGRVLKWVWDPVMEMPCKPMFASVWHEALGRQQTAHVQSIDRFSCVSIDDACTNVCSCRCILRALVVLHQAGFAHTDVRWANIILQHDGTWVLIDLELACVLDTVPYTPDRKPAHMLHLLCVL